MGCGIAWCRVPSPLKPRLAPSRLGGPEGHGSRLSGGFPSQSAVLTHSWRSLGVLESGSAPRLPLPTKFSIVPKIFMTFIVYTGGHRALSENQTTTSPGSSTGIPAGEHRMESKTDNLDVADGCKVSSHNGSLGTRSEIELHNPGTSTGCIVVSKKGRQHGDQMGPLFRHFNEFQKFIEPSCECSSSYGKNHANRLIPLFVWYNVPGDNFRGNKGKIDNNQNVPGENPSSQIPNFSDDEIAPHSETEPE